MNRDVIIALDFPTGAENSLTFDRFPSGEKPYVKIGMELFYAEGLTWSGHQGPKTQNFLDLKLHHIPNTVKRASGHFLSRLTWTW